MLPALKRSAGSSKTLSEAGEGWLAGLWLTGGVKPWGGIEASTIVPEEASPSPPTLSAEKLSGASQWARGMNRDRIPAGAPGTGAIHL